MTGDGGMSPEASAQIAEIVAIAAGCAIHFAVLPENEAGFLEYLNRNRPAGEQIPPSLLRKLMSMAHDRLAPDCDIQLGVE